MSDTRTQYLERTLTQLADGHLPSAANLTAALAELRYVQGLLAARDDDYRQRWPSGIPERHYP